MRVRLIRHDFLFGTAVNTAALIAVRPYAARYREFIAAHFSGLMDENSMKWYHVEKEREVPDFAQGDALVEFAAAHDLKLRGHCLLGDKTKYLPAWARELPGPELEPLALAEIRRMTERYRGRLVAWDVNNEMLDGGHYRERIGPDIEATFFKVVHATDPTTPLFVNEYHILDSNERTASYRELIRRLQAEGAPIGGIGIQEHGSGRLAGANTSVTPEKVE